MTFLEYTFFICDNLSAAHKKMMQKNDLEQ